MSADETETSNIDTRPLDPFGFFPHFISRIEGLGGSEPSFDPFFVFHTPYIPAPSGRWRFTLRFKNLRAQQGTLVLRIHVLPDAPGAAARLINSERLPLTRLSEDKASVTIDFVGMKNATFALMGQVPDRTDARADDLLVSVSGTDQTEDLGANTQNTTFRTDSVVANAIIVSPKEPMLADPVSQPCTARQCVEPAFSSWSKQLGKEGERGPDLWCDIYALQALDRYGVLRDGAKGLVTDTSNAAFVRTLLDRGVDLMSIPRTALNVAPALPPADFLYSVFGDGDIDRGTFVSTILSSMMLVRPGGMALYLVPYTHDNPDRRTDTTSALDRSDIEKLALVVVGKGHDLAQLRPSLSDAAHGRPNTMFGLIVRRAIAPTG